MNLEERILAFADLGEYLKNDIYKYDQERLSLAEILNPWFTQENISYSLNSWSKQLNKEMLSSWLDPYKLNDEVIAKKVLIVMAGNIPLVGFHDLLTVLICGHNVVVKMSKSDNILIDIIINRLIESGFRDYITFIDDVQERQFDAVITTGSNNSSRYFEYYFREVPRIIRKNRCSVAILDGSESVRDLEGLARDIFLYFGLGCRNVSKLYLPAGYDLDILFQSFYPYSNLLQHKKYANNYDYHKAIFLLGNHNLTENGFLLLKEDRSLFSPVSMLYYEFYNKRSSIDEFIADNSENLQCIVSKENIAFGESQKPNLWDYADGIDTIDFLRKI